jgi:hypothetical protein
LVLTSDPFPELSPDEPVPDPALMGTLVLINDPWPDPEEAVAFVTLPPALTGTLVLMRLPPPFVRDGTVPVPTGVVVEPVVPVPVVVDPGVVAVPALPAVFPELVGTEADGRAVPVLELVVPEGPVVFRGEAAHWPSPAADAVGVDVAEAASIPSEEAPRAVRRTTAARLLKVNILGGSPVRLVWSSWGVVRPVGR